MAKLSNKLSRFVVDEDDDVFGSPFQNNGGIDDEEERSSHRKKKVSLDDLDEVLDGKKKKKKKSLIDRIIEDGERLEEELFDDESIVALDRYLTEFAVDDEDIELRNALISKGRKYSRETRVSHESSEITKAFSGTERMLTDILEQVATDIEATQKDITQMRAMRTGRNYKVLTDMMMNKKELYGVKMNAIKELNNIKKTQFDIRAKIDKNKPIETGNSEVLVNQAIGSLLGSGRSNALSTVGGYSNVSGARGADEDYLENISDDEETIVEFEDTDEMDEIEEGRKYLQYESRGVELVLTEKDDGTYSISAEDKDGIEIPDYPVPSKANSLQFHVNEKLGTATDDYNRKYIYRKE